MTRRALGPAVAGLLSLLIAAPLGAQRPVVTIDAGHGGPEAGVEHEDLLEKDLVLQIAFVVGAEFVAQGWDVQYTRTGDHAVSWEDRRRLAEEAGADLLLMLHIMGNDDRSLHGAEVYWNPESPASTRAAALVAEGLRDTGSVVLEESRPWPFLQSTTVPTVMIELAHMTHPVERRLLLSDAFHHDLGDVLARAADQLLDGGR